MKTPIRNSDDEQQSVKSRDRNGVFGITGGETARLDPLVNAHVDFDFEALALLLKEESAELPDRDWDGLVKALKRILAWMLDGEKPHIVGKRAIGLAWTISPDYFDGSPSMRALARRYRLHKSVLSRYTAAATKKFGSKNRGSSHAWNRGKKQDVVNWQTQPVPPQPEKKGHKPR